MPGFRFDPRARTFTGPDGSPVPQAAIRKALDAALDAATARARSDGDAFAAGELNAAEFATRLRDAIKQTAAQGVAAAAGGWRQTTARDWSQAARFVKARYAELNALLTKYHRGAATGPQLAAWAAQLVLGGRAAYEAIRRQRDIAAGMTRERRVLGETSQSCDQCIAQAALGWQDAGVLLPIGACTCLDNCRCEFERR